MDKTNMQTVKSDLECARNKVSGILLGVGMRNLLTPNLEQLQDQCMDAEVAIMLAREALRREQRSVKRRI